MDVRELLEQVKSGAVKIEDAEHALKDLPYEDLGYAKLDHHRKLRSGFGETVFCQGKPDAYLMEIYKRFYERDGEVLGTRASEEQYMLVKAAVPEVVYDPISRILKVERPGKERKGLIAVCTGGTADIPVAEEAAQTAEYFGCAVDRIFDVGEQLFLMFGQVARNGDIISYYQIAKFAFFLVNRKADHVPLRRTTLLAPYIHFPNR